MNHLIRRVSFTRVVRFLAIVTPLFLAACDWGERMDEKVRLEVMSFDDLPGWQKDDSRHALMSFARSCQKFISYDGCPKQNSAIYLDCDHMKDICLKMPAHPDRVSRRAAKSFFEEYFTPYLVSDYQDGKVGTFTGYYQPAIKGSKTRTRQYSVPIYGPPNDLTRGKPYLTRAQIEDRGLEGKAKILYWTHPVDLFDLQTQGSGVLQLSNGRNIEIGYAGNNGHTYTSVTIEMKKRGMRPAQGFTAQGVLNHLKKQPYNVMRSILQTNPRYIFYKENGSGPIGSQGVVLTPQRSLAVDPKFIPLGVPLFLNTTAKGYAFQKLVMAQDTGSKILGAVRGDVYWGTGHKALEWAGKMKNDGTYYVLLPKNASLSYR